MTSSGQRALRRSGPQESPGAAGMTAITERIAYVRAIGIDPAITDTVHERRFDQYAREGAVTPAFLLSGYSVLRPAPGGGCRAAR